MVAMVEINDGHYLELMDRLHVTNSMIEDHITTHPLTNSLPEVKKLVEEAQSKLWEAYQLVGSLS
jgi:hypothetical protein